MGADPVFVEMASRIILIVILTLINAFFASAEMAIVSLNKNKIRSLAEEGNKKAQLLEKLMKEPTKFLSTIQVGITLAGFFSSAYAATSISDDFGNFLEKVNIPYGQDVALILVTVILSYFILVFGELYPKRLALKKPEAIALFSVKPIIVVLKVAAPFVKILSMSTNLLIRISGIKIDDLEEKVSREEIRSLIQVGQEQGAINATETEMINSIFEFDDKLAEEIMTPRTKVYLINIDRDIKEYLPGLLQTKHSRVPVFEGDRDNIIGVLYMKDFFEEAYNVGFDHVDVRKIIRPAYFVPERKNIDDLFKELQASKMQIAILIDEYGGFSGIVTMEDLIEEVMGDIDDEDDYKEEPDIQKINDYTYLVKGSTPVDDLNEQLSLGLDADSEDYDTIGGLLITLLGHIPSGAEERAIKCDNLVFKIEKVKNKRIEKVKLYIHKADSDIQEH